MPIIVDGYGELHAEMRLFLHFLEKGYRGPYPYIATSKLTCCHCNLVTQSLDVRVNGRHGKIHIWKAKGLIKKFVEDENYLKEIFGQKLYKNYKVIKDTPITIRLPDDKECSTTKGTAALLVFQLIGCLENNKTEFLEVLGAPHKKLYYQGSDYPGERSESIITPLTQEDFERKREEFLKTISERYIRVLSNADPAHGRLMWGGDIELGRIANLKNLNVTIHRPSEVPICVSPDIPNHNTTNVHILFNANVGHYQIADNEGNFLCDVPSDGNCLFHAVLGHALINSYSINDKTREEWQNEIRELRGEIAKALQADYNTCSNPTEQDPIIVRFSAIINATNEEALTGQRRLLQGFLLDEAEQLARRSPSFQRPEVNDFLPMLELSQQNTSTTSQEDTIVEQWLSGFSEDGGFCLPHMYFNSP